MRVSFPVLLTSPVRGSGSLSKVTIGARTSVLGEAAPYWSVEDPELTARTYLPASKDSVGLYFMLVPSLSDSPLIPLPETSHVSACFTVF